MAVFAAPRIPRSKLASLKITGWSGGYNSRDDITQIKDDELTSGSKNLVIDPAGALVSRTGRNLYGGYIGNITKPLGLFNFINLAGTQEQLCVHDTSILRYVTGVWTALTGVTMTTNLPADGCYFSNTNKFYVTNGTDAVVKYTSSTSGDQTDAAFKKGKYVIAFQDRLLVANVATQENYVWFTDLSVDTFTSTNYFTIPTGAITGLVVAPAIKSVLIFTKRSIHRLSNFIWDSVSARSQPPTYAISESIGCVSDKTIVEVNGLVYFLGQDEHDVAQVYVTDGSSVRPIGDIIRPDLAALQTTQLSGAAATNDGRFYRLSVGVSSSTANDSEYLHDTTRNIWLPRYDRGYSCYMTSETSGQRLIYAGDPVTGQIYKLTTTATYDETFNQSLLTGNSADTAVDADPAKRAAQSFQLSNDSGSTLTVSAISVFMKKNAGTTTGLTVRIETDSAGVPSGTLANANLTGTISAFTPTSYAWKTVNFSTPAALSADTTYWLVVQHTTEGAGDSQYYWASDSSSPPYTGGVNATYESAAWGAGTSDMLFQITAQEPIAFVARTKGYPMDSWGMEKWLSRIQFDSNTGTPLYLGVSNLSSTTYSSQLVTSTSGAATWGGGATWGDGSIYGGSARRQNVWLNPPIEVCRGRAFSLEFKATSTSQSTVYGASMHYKTARMLA